jgi:hypothetical protein
VGKPPLLAQRTREKWGTRHPATLSDAKGNVPQAISVIPSEDDRPRSDRSSQSRDLARGSAAGRALLAAATAYEL